MKEYKELYDSLLSSGVLFDVLPGATGKWEEDRKCFVNVQDELDYLAETQLYLDEEQEEQDEDIY
jgi:hypothetical protein